MVTSAQALTQIQSGMTVAQLRALTNLVGNAVATIVVARWEGELDKLALGQALKARETDLGA